MANYLLIESRDSFEGVAGFCAGLARTLAGNGDHVTVLLVQNGVLTARAGARTTSVAEWAAAGVAVRADAFSLRERGIAIDALAPAVRPAELDLVIDCMVDGWKVMWH